MPGCLCTPEAVDAFGSLSQRTRNPLNLLNCQFLSGFHWFWASCWPVPSGTGNLQTTFVSGMAGMRKFGTITTISKFLLVDVQVIRSLAHVQNQNISKSGIPHSHVTSTTITSCKKYSDIWEKILCCKVYPPPSMFDDGPKVTPVPARAWQIPTPTSKLGGCSSWLNIIVVFPRKSLLLWWSHYVQLFITQLGWHQICVDITHFHKPQGSRYTPYLGGWALEKPQIYHHRKMC